MTPFPRFWPVILLMTGVSFAEPPAPWEPLQVRARAEGLAFHPEWLGLLHMERQWGGRWRSRVDGANFFLSPRGKKDPRAELEATLRAFFDPPPLDPEVLHPQARFPARWVWLKSHLPFDANGPKEVISPRLEEWRGGLAVEGVTLVYASAYLNNPASMYGHTFLRLHRRGSSRENPLLDYTANFAADTAERSGLAFAVKGLLGGYPGRFSTHPYYMKVQQYNNMENRELWEYDLNLSTAQVRRMMDHLWELGQTSFDYFFLTENCSYQLLPLLEVADPSRSLRGGFGLKAVPVDTLRRVLNAPGLVENRRVRPARIEEILARRRRLSPVERRWVEAAGRRPDAGAFAGLVSFPPERQGLVLESAYDLFRLRHGFGRYAAPEVEAQEHRLLAERGARPPAAPEDIPVPRVSDPPESCHPTGRLSLGIGVERGRGFEEVEVRPALHELTDPTPGFPSGSQLAMFSLKLRRAREAGPLFLERGALVDIVSLTPWDGWTRSPSWKFFMGWERLRDGERRPPRALAFTLHGGSGATVGTPRGLLFARGEGDLGVGGIYEKNARLGTGIALGGVWAPTPVWRSALEGGVRRYFWGDLGTVTRWSWVQQLSWNPRWGVRWELSRVGGSRESLGSFLYYW